MNRIGIINCFSIKYGKTFQNAKVRNLGKGRLFPLLFGGICGIMTATYYAGICPYQKEIAFGFGIKSS